MQDTGLATLLHSVKKDGHALETLHTVALLEQSASRSWYLVARMRCSPAPCMNNMSRSRRCGAVVTVQPLGGALGALPEEIRDSNRAQALHISEKLKAVQCDIYR